MSLAREVRKLFSNILIFKPSKVEMENLMLEQFEMHKETAIDLMNFVFTDNHDYLFLNVESQRMYKNFDEVIIHQDDEDSNEYSDGDSEK